MRFGSSVSALACGVIGFLLLSSLPSGASTAALMENTGLNRDGTNRWPASWFDWGYPAHGANTNTFLSAPCSWEISGDAGLWQDLYLEVYPGDVLRIRGNLRTPSSDALRNGTKCGTVELEFYRGQGATPMSVVTAQTISASSSQDVWIPGELLVVVPINATHARLVVRCRNAASGSGRFMADDVSVANVTRSPNLLRNAWLDYNSGDLPTAWSGWDTAEQGVCTQFMRSVNNAWQMWGGDVGMYQDVTTGFVPGDTVRYGAYILSPSNALLDGLDDYAKVVLEFYDASNTVIGTTGKGAVHDLNSYALSWPTYTGSVWYCAQSRTVVPAGTAKIRYVVRHGDWYNGALGGGRFVVDDPLLANESLEACVSANPELSGVSPAPHGWANWNDGSHDPDWGTFVTPEDSWTFWWEGGLYQDVTGRDVLGLNCAFGASLLTPSWDVLRNGTKAGSVELEFYNGATLLGVRTAGTINASSPADSWIKVRGVAAIPTNATTMRAVVRCNAGTGDGRFLVDNVCVQSAVVLPECVISQRLYTCSADVPSVPCLTALGGKPGVLYYDGYSRAKFACNTSSNVFTGGWTCNDPQVDDELVPDSIDTCSISGKPFAAFCYYDNVKIACGTNANGSGTWAKRIVRYVDWDSLHMPAPAAVNGTPALTMVTSAHWMSGKGIYTWESYLDYMRCSTADGSGAWTTNRISTITEIGYSAVLPVAIRNGTMALIGGKPACCFAASPTGLVKFAISTNVNGSGTWQVYTVASNTTAFAATTNKYRGTCLAEVAGRPAIAYASSNHLMFAISTNVTGAGRWTVTTIRSNAYPANVCLTMVGGKPAIAYGNTTSNLLMYAVNSATNGSGSWTVRPLAGSCRRVGGLVDIGGAPCISYDSLYNQLKIVQ